MAVMAAANDEEEIVYNASFTIQNPKTGKKAIYDIESSDPDKYYAEVVGWFDEDTGKLISRYSYEEDCYLQIIVRTKPGYKFSNGATIAINGSTARTVPDSESTDYLRYVEDDFLAEVTFFGMMLYIIPNFFGLISGIFHDIFAKPE